MNSKNIIKNIIQMFPFGFKKIYAILRFYILPISKIESLLPSKGLILDVGCGYGISSAFFALSNKNRQVVASEINNYRVQFAQKIFKNIPNLKLENANLIEQDKQKFDAIIAIDLLHHISKKDKNIFLKNSFKVLSKNGYLIIKDINTKPKLKYYWNYLHDLIMTKFSKLYFLSNSQMISLIQKNNFKIIKTGYYAKTFYPHIFYVCQKNK